MRTAAGGDNTRRSTRARKAHFFAAGDDDVDMGAAEEQAAAAGGKWPHGLRSTRLKILALGASLRRDSPTLDSADQLAFYSQRSPARCYD